MTDITKAYNTIQKVGKGGKIFSVEFIKKNGEKRKMSARLGVKSRLRGGVSTTSHLNHLLTVFSVDADNYRNVDLSTVFCVRGKGREYRF